MPGRELSNCTAVLRGRRWAIRFLPRLPEGAHGEIDPNDNPCKQIRIALDQSPEAMLDTLLHECLHACVPDLSEDAVDETATDIAHLLYRMGLTIDTVAMRRNGSG